jgi:hypothetical protein
MNPPGRLFIRGVPAVGHISPAGWWHPRQPDGCRKCPPDWTRGEAVTVVEYGPGRRPRPDGLRFTARVTGTAGRQVLIRYDDPAAAGRQTDQFWAESGWRAWDGEQRWKLHHGRQSARSRKRHEPADLSATRPPPPDRSPAR